MIKLLILLLSFCLTCPALAAVYKSVRPDGTVVYSDQPPKENARPLDLPPLQTMPAENLAPTTPNPEPTSQPAAPPELYQSLNIVLPEPDSTVHDAGQVSVQLALEPALSTKEGDYIEVFLDGKSVARGSGTAFILGNVERGSHTLEASVLSQAGQTLISSPAVTFFVHRPTVNRPGR